jgi:hypothetical protein
MRAAVVVGCLLVATHVAHADLAITKAGVEVAPAKADGKKWDRGLGPEPDPAIELFVDGERIQTCPPIQDAFKGDCAISKQRTYAGDIAVELRVKDADLAADDTIGNARGTIPGGARGRIALAVDGQLQAAWVEVEYAQGPTVMQRLGRHIGVRSIGGVLGVLLALLLYRLLGARFLTPGPRSDVPRATRPPVNFWRSPILLASAGASIVGIVLANLLRDPQLPFVLGTLPYVLGGFGFMAPIIDAHKHQHLGGKRLRLVIAGVAAMFAVPLYDFSRDLFTGISFLARHLGWTFVGILLLLCLL